MDIYPVGLASSSRGRDYIPLPLTDADEKIDCRKAPPGYSAMKGEMRNEILSGIFTQVVSLDEWG